MVTNLVGMAANLLCGTPVPTQPTDPIAAADEQRQESEATVLGQVSAAYYSGWSAQVPDSVGPAAAVSQPRDRHRFDTATFSWLGGDNWTDTPTVSVQRRINGAWSDYADQSGEIQTVLDRRPALSTEALSHYAGRQRWTWTANFEVFDSYPRADVPGGQVPNGRYRFVVNGQIHTGGAARPYHLASDPFTVSPWNGVRLRNGRVRHGRASFRVAPLHYPRLPTHVPPQLPFYADDRGATGKPGASLICATCSFQPWASTSHVVAASIEIVRHGRIVRRLAATPTGRGRWVASVTLSRGEHAVVARHAVRDAYGETNGHALRLG
jgi:hypothetical protein